ncbi:transient receptor potential cation channel subfamily A member 1 homolog [Panulirus ornatus]|uniref:transient receptor potential cation channel subfamily A member 1 homolog n=1 Tax=Panulirus ornatus TaxID=150431 RepID=UPI003A83626C
MMNSVVHQRRVVYVSINVDDTDGSSSKGKRPLCEAVTSKDFQLCQKLLADGENVDYIDDENGSTLLHILAKKYSKQETRAQKIPALLLQHGANVNAKDKDGNTPLHIAAREGKQDLCAILLEHQKTDGASPKVNIKNKKSMTPMHYAAQQGQIQVVELLIKEGANPSIKDNQKYFPLHHAADRGFHECCKVLAPFYPNDAADDKEQIPPVMLAARKGHYLCYKEMNDAKMNLSYRDIVGNTALHIVAKLGFEKFVGLLLDMGAPPNIQNNFGNTPLMEAIMKCRTSCVNILMDKGANLDMKNNSQSGVLHVAASKKAEDCLDSLLKNEDVKKNIDEKDKDGYTALCIAVKKQYEKCAILLLNAGASPKVVCQQKLSLLHVAAENMKSFLIEKLLTFPGLDLNLQNKDGETPLHVAARKGSREACQMLLRKGARIDVQDENGRTALHLSAYQGHSSIVRLLIKSGANKRAKDDKKSTALHAAAAKGNLECCEILTDADKALYKEQDKKKRYALDVAFQKGHDKVFHFLLHILPYRNISTMPQDLSEHLHSHTHNAIKNRNRTVVEAIVKSHWWEAGFGAAKKHEGVYCTNFRELIRLYPVLAMKVMDKCTTLSDTSDAVYDFTIFEDNYYIKEEKKATTPFDPKTWKVLSSAEELTSDVLVWKKEHPVNIMAHHRCLGLLQHPLTEAWLNYKWKSYSRQIFLILLFLQLFSVGVLLAFMKSVQNWKHIQDVYNMTQEEFCNANLRPLKDSFQSMDVTITETATTTQSVQVAQKWNSAVSHTCHILLLISVIVQVIVELNNAIRMQWHYVNSTILVVRFPCLILSTVLLIPSSYCGLALGIKTVFIWQCGIVALLIHWFHLIHTINKVPQFSIFTTITKDFLRDFFKGLMFIGMVISLFALIFHLLLQDQPAFKTVPQSVVKTVVWLLGDLGYDDTFLTESLSYPVLANILFLVFVCTVAIFIVTLIRAPSLDEKEIQLYRKAVQAELILNFDVCYPWCRRAYSVGKYCNKDKNPWILTKIENFLKPKGLWVVHNLSKEFDKAALMNIHEHKEDNKHWIVSKLEKILKIFSYTTNESVNSELPHPLQDQLEEQTKKLDQLLALYNQLNGNYQKQNEQILELRQHLDSLKHKSRSSMVIT